MIPRISLVSGLHTKRIVGGICFASLVMIGCGKSGAPTKVVFGKVTCGDAPVTTGQVSFMPIEGTPGANSVTPIANGQYRLEARGGVPLGKHRVRVDARKKTGRQVEGSNGREVTMMDEEVRVGPAVYGTEQSPLVVEVNRDCDGQFDITIPRE